MALRVIQPARLRSAAFLAALAGVLLVVVGVAGGPVALAGAILLSAAGAAFDALGEGRVGLRQLGVFLAALGSGLGIWALLVMALMTLLAIGPVPGAVYVVFATALAAVAAGVRMIVVGSRESAASARTARTTARRPSAPRARPGRRRLTEVGTARRAESLRA